MPLPAAADWLQEVCRRLQQKQQPESRQVQQLEAAWLRDKAKISILKELPAKWLEWLASQGPTGRWLQGQWVHALQVCC